MQTHNATLATHQFPAHDARMNEQESNNPYGDRIRAARLRKGWDQDALADAVNRDTSWVSREEGGRRNLPDVNLYRALCDALDIPLRDLLEAKGYLDPVELEPGVLYEIREGDPRALLLDQVKDWPPEDVEGLAVGLNGIFKLLSGRRSNRNPFDRMDPGA